MFWAGIIFLKIMVKWCHLRICCLVIMLCVIALVLISLRTFWSPPFDSSTHYSPPLVTNLISFYDCGFLDMFFFLRFGECYHFLFLSDFWVSIVIQQHCCKWVCCWISASHCVGCSLILHSNPVRCGCGCLYYLQSIDVLVQIHSL